MFLFFSLYIHVYRENERERERERDRGRTKDREREKTKHTNNIHINIYIYIYICRYGVESCDIKRAVVGRGTGVGHGLWTVAPESLRTRVFMIYKRMTPSV